MVKIGSLSSKSVTETKISLKNKNLGNAGYFAIIASSSHPILLTAFKSTGRSAVETNIEKRDLLLCGEP